MPLLARPPNPQKIAGNRIDKNHYKTKALSNIQDKKLSETLNAKCEAAFESSATTSMLFKPSWDL